MEENKKFEKLKQLKMLRLLVFHYLMKVRDLFFWINDIAIKSPVDYGKVYKDLNVFFNTLEKVIMDGRDEEMEKIHFDVLDIEDEFFIYEEEKTIVENFFESLGNEFIGAMENYFSVSHLPDTTKKQLKKALEQKNYAMILFILFQEEHSNDKGIFLN